MALRLLIYLCLVVYAFPVFAQVNILPATRIMNAPRIDGNLDDEIWATAPVAKDFIQNIPEYGKPATVRSEVRIVYDNSAIYIGAYLFDDPSLIRKQLTARDEELRADVDYFSVFFDTYNDKQNGFQFLVTTRNVQSDARLGPTLGGSFGDYGTKSWDAVWESEVQMKEDGWVVEMRIPYISLRFAEKDVQDWGLQLLRFTRRNNETSFWNKVDPNVNGFVFQFGRFTGLTDIQPPLRLSFSPYVSTGIRITPQPNGSDKGEWLRNGGMDVKYGINESFTLDATLIPDFGQVISDNVVNNLTPFEIRFSENRPFFTEGTELFNKAGLFYSRRVGRMPSGYYGIKGMVMGDPNLEIIKNPTLTQLYNAIKLSGRTKQKLGIGFFNAVTAPMHATIRNRSTGIKTRIETEPLANYNIVVLDQSLKGSSYVTLTNTNVIRNGSARDANVSSLDFSFFNKDNEFNVRGTGRYSTITGTENYDGYATMLRAGKVSGKWQYTATGGIESDFFDPNDLGFATAVNEINYQADISYNQNTATKNFLNYRYSLSVLYDRLYKPNAFREIQLQASAFWIFRNFWDLTLLAGILPKNQHDYFVLNTPARFVQRPAFNFGLIEGSSDSRKRLFVYWEFLNAWFNVDNQKYHILELGARYRFSDRFSLDISSHRERETNYIVYAGSEASGEPIVGFVNYKDHTSILSGIYHFTPRINMTFRTRHYWSNVLFQSFANVNADGSTTARAFIPNRDQNVNIFNIDAFLTWDFRLGSRVVAGYKNWLGEDESVDGITNKSYFRNFSKTFNLRHANEFTIRFIYFLDYNQLRKKRK